MRADVLADLRRDEGWREHAYQDTLGWWTIGYGFLVDSRRGAGMPKVIGEAWLGLLVDRLERELDLRAAWWRNQPEQVQRALLNMAYQLGASGLLNFRNMIAALRAGDRRAAAAHALDSRWARQTPNRAARVAAMLRGDT